MHSPFQFICHVKILCFCMSHRIHVSPEIASTSSENFSPPLPRNLSKLIDTVVAATTGNKVDLTFGMTHPLSDCMPLMSTVAYPMTFLLFYVSYCFFATELRVLRPHYRNFPLYRMLNVSRINIQLLIGCLLAYCVSRSGRDIVYSDVPGTEALGENKPYSLIVAWLLWSFHVIKILRLLDIILIVRGGVEVNRFNIYYNAGVVFLTWTAVKYYPGGSTIFPVVVNCLAEFCFYIGQEANKRSQTLEWNTIHKTVNIVQVLTIFMHALIGMIVDSGYPKLIFMVTILYIISFVAVVMVGWEASLDKVTGAFCFYYDHDEFSRLAVRRFRALEIVYRHQQQRLELQQQHQQLPRPLRDLGAAGDCHPLGYINLRRRMDPPAVMPQ